MSVRDGEQGFAQVRAFRVWAAALSLLLLGKTDPLASDPPTNVQPEVKAISVPLSAPAVTLAGPGQPDRASRDRRRPPELRTPPDELCDTHEELTGRELTQAVVDSIGKKFSRHNARVIERADSLLRARVFGEPADPAAQREAALFLELRSRNAMDLILELALQPEVSWFDSRHDLSPLLRTHANLAMYPLRHTDKGRIGRGAFCLRYRVPAGYDETFHFGGSAIRMRGERAKLPDGREVDVLNREWLSGDGSKLELLYAETFSGRVTREIIDDRGDKLELITIADISGLYVRKHGTHLLTTMTVWRSLVDGDDPPARPRVGGAAYFPRIQLRLPVFLPDFGLDDLRELPYPPPIMDATLFEGAREAFPTWVRTTPAAQFLDWVAVGEWPEILHERYPDM